MSKQRRVQLNIFGGESAHALPAVGRVTSRTTNWLPSAEGKLKTYTGGKRVLAGEDPTPGNPGNNGPVAWDDKWVTGGVFFTDILGIRRLVVIVNNEAYDVVGNKAVLIFQWPDNIYTDGDYHSIEILTHQNHVIMLHPNFPPVKWGGDYPVSWLGVRDIPQTPEIHTFETFSEYFESTAAWGINTNHYEPPVFLQHDDATEPEFRGFWYKGAFMNARGQLGRWGDKTWLDLPPSNGDQTLRRHPIVEWFRPKDQGPDFLLSQTPGHPTGNGTDITHFVLARTNNTYVDRDAGAFFIQGVYPYTMNRVTDQVPDAGLGLLIDEDNYPAPAASFGCVFRDTLFLSGNLEDPNGVWWSKGGMMEAWPPLNYHKASGRVTNIVALPDRVCVITENSIEVLRQNETGFFAMFRKETSKGSSYGRSIVAYKGSLFGIFDGGFGVFDGFAYKGIADEFGELFDLITRANGDRIRAFVDTRGRYFLCVNYANSNAESGTGLVLMYDFTLNAWFRINEQAATCFFEEEDELYFGGKDNFRMFDAGIGGLSHTLEFFVSMEQQNAQFGLAHKELMDMFVRIASTGDYKATVKFFVDEILAEEVSTGEFSTRLGKPGLTDAITDSVWDESVLDDNASWDAPRHGWQKVKIHNPVEWYTLRVQITVPGQAYAEISGVSMDIEVEDTQTPL